jgi:hypothetical protein
LSQSNAIVHFLFECSGLLTPKICFGTNEKIFFLKIDFSPIASSIEFPFVIIRWSHNFSPSIFHITSKWFLLLLPPKTKLKSSLSALAALSEEWDGITAFKCWVLNVPLLSFATLLNLGSWVEVS